MSREWKWNQWRAIRGMSDMQHVSAGAAAGCESCGLGDLSYTVNFPDDEHMRRVNDADFGAFMKSPCDVCGDPYHGQRYPAHGFAAHPPGAATSAAEHIHLDVCGDCKMYIANAVIPDDAETTMDDVDVGTWAELCGITLSSERIPDERVPRYRREQYENGSHWRCRVRNGDAAMRTTFSMSSAYRDPPTLGMVLAALILDAKSVGAYVPDRADLWLRDMGYAPDEAVEGMRAWNTATKNADHLRHVLGDDLYAEAMRLDIQ